MMKMLGEVFDKSTDAVFGIDAAGRVLFANSAFERLLGYSHNQWCSTRCSKLLCGTDLHGQPFCGPRCPIPKMTTDQPLSSDFDLVVKHADGHDVLVNIGTSYIKRQLKEEARQVDVFFSMRQVSPQRMLQRMARALVEGSVKNCRYGRYRLTSREEEILGLAVNRKKTSQIACCLSISTHTVRSHFKNIYKKLGVNSRTEAVIIALQQELTRPGMK